MQVHELAERVQKLEDENRRLKSLTRRWGLGLAAIGGAAVLMSMTTAMCKTVWAERFVLQDSSGRERGVITAYETGGVPKFTLFDAKGSSALAFGVDEKGRSFLEVPGAEGMVRSHFAISAEGNATIDAPAKTKQECEKKKDGDVAALTR